MKSTAVIITCLMILVTGAAAFFVFMYFRPEAERKVLTRDLVDVEVQEVRVSTATIKIESQGTVEPVKATTIASQVAGKIEFVDPRLEVGAAYETSAVLLKIEDGDYKAAQIDAASALAAAELAVKSEEATAAQKRREWKKLGSKGEPSELVVRIPQLASARARLAAAKAAVDKAERDFNRTTIRAPYPCRIKEKYIEDGALVTVGVPLVDVYSDGDYEVRLPVSLDDFAFVPPLDRVGGARPEVTFSATIAGTLHTWRGEVVRTQGEVDRKNRSVYLVATIRPLEDDAGGKPVPDKFLAPGLFVRAVITGTELPGLVSVPRTAMRDRDTVLVVKNIEDKKSGRKKSIIKFRKVTVAREEKHTVYISENLSEGELVSVTGIDSAVDEMEIRVWKPGENTKKGSPGSREEAINRQKSPEIGTSSE